MQTTSARSLWSATRLVRYGWVGLMVLLLAACHYDMYNQPRVQTYAPSSFFADGRADRPAEDYRAALGRNPVAGRITLSGYEGSELLVARLLVESGADVRYVGSACPKTPWSANDLAWLQAKGVQVQYRASLEQDLAAMREYEPQLVIGTTPVVQAAKEARIPALYFTNLISARPLMGVMGAGSLAYVFTTPPDPKLSTTNFDFDRDPASFEPLIDEARSALREAEEPNGGSFC